MCEALGDGVEGSFNHGVYKASKCTLITNSRAYNCFKRLQPHFLLVNRTSSNHKMLIDCAYSAYGHQSEMSLVPTRLHNAFVRSL